MFQRFLATVEPLQSGAFKSVVNILANKNIDFDEHLFIVKPVNWVHENFDVFENLNTFLIRRNHFLITPHD